MRRLREDGARFGKTSKGWFFGFKLHALRHVSGRVLNLLLTPANYDDREPAAALAAGVEGGTTLRGSRPGRGLTTVSSSRVCPSGITGRASSSASSVKRGAELGGPALTPAC